MRLEGLVADRYRLERLLGGGGMAVVYAARDERLGRPVAVKLLADNLAQHTEIRERFLREARIASGLSHPSVIEVYDSGEDGRPFIVMEYAAGGTLAAEVRRSGALPPDRAARLLAQAADGLAHAHARGIVHRDVKPENLLLVDGDTLKVADFGIAHAVEGTRLTATGTVLGTASYLAPEQAAGAPVTPAADVYALGAVLFELLTGELPHTAPWPEAFPDAMPPGLDNLIERSLAADPGGRPTAVEFRDALRGDGEALTRVLRRDHVRSYRSGSVRRWLPLAAPIAAAIAVGAGAIAVTASRDHGSKPRPRVPPVARIPPAATPAQEARNLAAWLRRYSAKG